MQVARGGLHRRSGATCTACTTYTCSVHSSVVYLYCRGYEHAKLVAVGGSIVLPSHSAPVEMNEPVWGGLAGIATQHTVLSILMAPSPRP